MRAIVTTSSSKLVDLLSTADKETVVKRCGSTSKNLPYLFFMQVVGGNDVYVEFYQDATVANGVKVAKTTGEFSFALSDLHHARVIADVANSEVRVLINS